jgi:hypothetical protein
MKKLQVFVVLCLAVLAVGIVPVAQAGLVTCRTGAGCLNGNDYYDWTKSYGPPRTSVPPMSMAMSQVNMTMAMVMFDNMMGNGMREDQGNGWNGNFNPGDSLLWTNNQGPLTFMFSHSLWGIGANIQPNFDGMYMPMLCDNNGMCVMEMGNSNSNGDGSAVFLGLNDPMGFTSVTFSLMPMMCGNACNDFAINQMDIQTTPEPGTMMLLGSGLISVVAYGRRRLGL